MEASGFYGSEPDEYRWNIDWGPMNSYSGRVSIMLSSGSTGHLEAALDWMLSRMRGALGTEEGRPSPARTQKHPARAAPAADGR